MRTAYSNAINVMFYMQRQHDNYLNTKADIGHGFEMEMWTRVYST